MLVVAQFATALTVLSTSVLTVVLTTGLVLADELVEGSGSRVLSGWKGNCRAILGYGALHLVRHEGLDSSVTLCRGELLLAVVVEEVGERDIRVAHVEEDLFELLEEMRTSSSVMECMRLHHTDYVLTAVGDLSSLAHSLRSLCMAGEVLDLLAGGTLLPRCHGDWLTAGIRALFGHLVDNLVIGSLGGEGTVGPSNTATLVCR